MPQIKSAEKRLRQSVGRTARNRAVKARVRSGRRAVLEALRAGDAAKASTALRHYHSLLDRALIKGTLKKNFVRRQKSRFQGRVNGLTPSE